MSENETSGSRWEPTENDDHAEETTEAPAAEAPAVADAPTPAAEVSAAPAPGAVVISRRPSWLTGQRGAAAAVAAGALVVGGAAGFGIGHATAGDDGNHRPGFSQRFRDGGPGGESGFGGPGGNTGGNGQQPPSFQNQDGTQNGSQGAPGTTS